MTHAAILKMSLNIVPAAAQTTNAKIIITTIITIIKPTVIVTGTRIDSARKTTFIGTTRVAISKIYIKVAIMATKNVNTEIAWPKLRQVIHRRHKQSTQTTIERHAIRVISIGMTP